MNATEHRDFTDPSHDGKELKRVLVSSFIGSAIEYYDLLVYVTAASLIFGKLFFTGLSPEASQLASLGTLAVGYISRPVGAALFGHFGDQYGRKKMLIVTLLIMGLATTAIGLLPTAAQIGIWSPIILISLRLVQGFSAGGEWGGAALMAYEHAPPGRRAFAASVSAAGGPTGTMLAAIMLGLCAQLPTEDFEAWGWRIPFLISFLFIAFGLWIRLKVEESPLFVRERERQAASPTESKAPLLQIFGSRQAITALVLSTMAIMPNFIFNSLAGSVGLTYADSIGLSISAILIIQAVSSFLCAVSELVSGLLTDRFGYRKVMGFGIILGSVFAYPYMLLISSGNLTQVLIAFVVMYALVLAPIGGPSPGYLAEQFSTGARYTGSSLGYQISAMIGGGTGPIILFSLLRMGGGSFLYLSIFMAVSGAVCFLCFLKTTSPGLEEEIEGQAVH